MQGGVRLSYIIVARCLVLYGNCAVRRSNVRYRYDNILSRHCYVEYSKVIVYVWLSYVRLSSGTVIVR